jgi:hypothetical protein
MWLAYDAVHGGRYDAVHGGRYDAVHGGRQVPGPKVPR